MTQEQIFKKIKRFHSSTVTLTGGEIFCQDIASLIVSLKDNHYTVRIETNGDYDLKDYRFNIDWITMSPKGSVKKSNFQYADEVKYVVDKTDWQVPTSLLSTNFKGQVFLQPESNRKEMIKRCLELLKQNQMMRLSLQTQKIINIK